MEKNEIDPYRDYFEMMSSEREANMNRQGYKRMKSDFLQEQGLDPLLIDLDYAYDAGNEQNTDILPAVSKKEDDSVTEDILLDTNTREGMAWAAASKVMYDAFYGQKQTASNAMATDRQGRRNQFNFKRHYRDAPKTPQEFAQWGIEHIGWLNYNLPSLGVASTKLPYIVKKNPKAAYAFLHLLNTYGKLPMFTWNGTKRFFNGVLKDPTTYVGLGTLGIGLAGKKFATAAGKGGLKKALRAAIDPAAITMYEGALYAASDDFFRQKVAIEAGPGVEGGQEGYSPSKGALAATTGAVFAGGLYGTAKVAPYAYDAVKGVLKKSGENAQTRMKERSSGTQLYSNPVGPIVDPILSKLGGGGDGPPPGRQLDNLGFYSKGREALVNMQQTKGTGEQFLKQLENQFNVKPSELYWFGLEKFRNNQVVNKQELIDTIDENYVELKEYKFLDEQTNDVGERIDDLTFTLEDQTESYYFDGDITNLHDDYRSGRGNIDFTNELIEALGFIPPNNRGQYLAETDPDGLLNSERLEEAIDNGETEFIDADGETIDFGYDLDTFIHDLAERNYLQNPLKRGQDDQGLGYIIEGNDDSSYRVQDPSGRVVVDYGEVFSANEANVRASQDAFEQGYLRGSDYEPDPSELSDPAASRSDEAEIAGEVENKQFKLEKGTNYREIVLSNDSFVTDPGYDEMVAAVKQSVNLDNYYARRDVSDLIFATRNIATTVPESEQLLAFENILADNDLYQTGYGIVNDVLAAKKTLKAAMENDIVGREFIQHVKNKNPFQAKSSLRNFLLNYDNKLRMEVQNDHELIQRALKPYNMTETIQRDPLQHIKDALSNTPRTHYSHKAPKDIGHIRVTNRVGPMGQKIFFIEEMQSDWSQRGRDAMPTPENVEKGTRLAAARDSQAEAVNYLNGEMDKVINQIRNLSNEEKSAIYDQIKNNILDAIDASGLELNYADFRTGQKFTPEGGQTQFESIRDLLETGIAAEEKKSTKEAIFDKIFENFSGAAKRNLQNLLTEQYKPTTIQGVRVVPSGDTLTEILNNNGALMRAFIMNLDNSGVANALTQVVDPTGNVNIRTSNNYPGVTRLEDVKLPIDFGGLSTMVDALEGINVPEAQRPNLKSSMETLNELQDFEKNRNRYKFIPRGPFVGRSQDIAELQLKTAIRRAIEEGNDFVVVANAETQIDRWGETYRKSFEQHYGKTIPKMATRIMKQLGLGDNTKPYLAPIEDVGLVTDRTGQAPSANAKVLVIPLNEAMRDSVKKGMSLFELGSLAAGGGAAVAGSQMTQQENTEPGI